MKNYSLIAHEDSTELVYNDNSHVTGVCYIPLDKGESILKSHLYHHFVIFILKAGKNMKMIVAPIGTKPHTIASIAFAITHFNNVEIAYDNPKKTEPRAEGVGLILDCNMTKLLSENP